MLTTENFQPPSTLPKKNSSLHLSHWSAGFIYIYIYNAVQFFLSPLLLFHHISLIGRQYAMHIFMMQYNYVRPPTCCIHILWKCLSTLSACPQRDSKVASRYRYSYLFWLIGERKVVVVAALAVDQRWWWWWGWSTVTTMVVVLVVDHWWLWWLVIGN